MNWRDCVWLNESVGVRSRFEWPVGAGKSGFDCDPAFTPDDLMGALGWTLTWPGDYLVSSPGVRSFLRIEPQATVGNLWSACLAVLVLMLLAVCLHR
jgi:hypothetical protein